MIYIGCEDGTLHTWIPSLKIIVPIDEDNLIKQYAIDNVTVKDVIAAEEEESSMKDYTITNL